MGTGFTGKDECLVCVCVCVCVIVQRNTRQKGMRQKMVPLGEIGQPHHAVWLKTPPALPSRAAKRAAGLMLSPFRANPAKGREPKRGKPHLRTEEAWSQALSRKAGEVILQGSIHYTPEHCLVNGGFPSCWWKRPCFKWANVSFKEPCFTCMLSDHHGKWNHCADYEWKTSERTNRQKYLFL